MQVKRQLMIAAAAVLFTMLALPSTAPAQSREGGAVAAAGHRDPLVGTWIVRVTPAVGNPFTTINNFNRGGDFVQIETQASRPALGQWVWTDDLTYHLDFMFFAFDLTTGVANARVTVHVDITLDESLEAFTATYEFQVVNSDGTVARGHGIREGRRTNFDFEP